MRLTGAAREPDMTACRTCELKGIPPEPPLTDVQGEGKRVREQARKRNAARKPAPKPKYVHRRRAASQRLEPLLCGCRDPYICPHSSSRGGRA